MLLSYFELHLVWMSVVAGNMVENDLFSLRAKTEIGFDRSPLFGLIESVCFAAFFFCFVSF